MNCDYCKNPHPAKDCILPDGTEQILCSRDGLFGDCYIHERKVNFCKECGRPLSKPEPLSLEKLRGADGECVWIEIKKSNPPHVIKSGLFILSTHDKDIFACNKHGQILCISHLYGERWLAYTHKPEREGGI